MVDDGWQGSFKAWDEVGRQPNSMIAYLEIILLEQRIQHDDKVYLGYVSPDAFARPFEKRRRSYGSGNGKRRHRVETRRETWTQKW